jgi:ABC-type sugar transport system ATPase subunit
MPKIVLKNVSKSYGRVVALKDVNLEVNDGEFVCLLGPPGSGRTTILKLIAGLEEPDSGEIYIGGRLVNKVPPQERGVSMMFESLALYPHMNVYENLAFPLRKLKLPEKEIEARVKEVTGLLKIDFLLDRRPAQLSGGERQRVALARALIKKPSIILLDEPLGHLDAKLRLHSRVEITKIQRKLKQTAIMSTFDSLDAISTADRIAFMERGRIVQYDTPKGIYDKPKNVLVASSIGSPPMNLIHCVLRKRNEKMYVYSENLELDVTKFKDQLSDKVDSKLTLGVRPSDIKVSEKPPGTESKVYAVEPIGRENILTLNIGSITLLAKVPSSIILRPEDKVWINPEIGKIHLFDQSGETIL